MVIRAHLPPLRYAAVAAALALSPACGKAPNGERPLLHFAHTLPEAPRALDLSRGLHADPSATGGPIASRDTDLLVVDRDGGALVRVDRASLSPLASIDVGERPEQVLVTPAGDVWVSLRGSGELVRLSEELEIVERVVVGVDAFGLAAAPDGQTVFSSLPFNGEVVAVAPGADGRYAVVARAAVGDLPRGLTFAPASTGREPALVVAHQRGEATRVPVVELPSGLGLDATAVTRLTLRDANPGEFVDSFGDTHRRRSRVLVPTRAIAVATNPENGGVHVAHVLAAPGSPSDLVQRLEEDLSGGSDRSSASSNAGGYGSSSGPSFSGRTFDVPVRPVEVTVTTIAADSAESLPIEPSLVVKDPASGEPMLHRVDQPVDVRHHPTMSLLFIVGEGTDNVLVLSTAENDAARSPVALFDVGSAPRGITFSRDGATAWVLNGFDFSVSELDLSPLLSMRAVERHDALPRRADDDGFALSAPSPDFGLFPEEGSPGRSPTTIGADPSPDSPRVRPLALVASRSVPFAADPWPAELRLGARIFTHARNESISHAGQFACSTCHFEGTEDGVVWVTPDGIRQTIALGGRLEGTGPFNWNGSEDALQDNMDKTIARMGGEGLDPLERAALERFLLEGLPAVPNPHRTASDAPTDLIARGEALFNDPEVGCAGCHRPEQRFMDGFAHDVGTAHEAELARWALMQSQDPTVPYPGRRNTPSLEGLFFTAPYLSDGSARTLREVFERTRDTMGRTSHLSEDDLEALVAYLKTL